MKIAVCLGILALIFIVYCVDTISPRSSTQSAIMETFVRINMYAETNKTLPLSLDVLPRRDGYANQITDGWKRPLQYQVAQDGVITLTSLGRDGKPGGDGEDGDISASYRTRRPDGSLWVGSEKWIVEARVR